MSDITQKVDITYLAQYVNKIGELSSVNKAMAPTYLRDYIIGQDVAANLLAKAIQADCKVKAQLEYAESIAYLERAKDYLESKGIKDTADARKRFVDIDADVVTLKDKKASTEALVVLLKSKLNELRQAYEALKKITYSGDYGTTPYEGT